MGVKSYVTESIYTLDKNDNPVLAVPVFKKEFSKNVKAIWDKLDNSTDTDSLKDVYDLVNSAIENLEFLKKNLLNYSSYSSKKEDHI